MAGAYGIPYRPPCGGWNPGKIYDLCANAHYVPEHASIAKHTNNTLVDDVTPDAAEEPWAEPYVANTYAAGGTVNLAACRKIGFKVVQAFKAWHGRFGWLSHDAFGCSRYIGGDCNCNFEAEQPTPDTTKYLSVSREVWMDAYQRPGDPPGVLPQNAGITESYSVARNTGVVTQNSCSTYWNIDGVDQESTAFLSCNNLELSSACAVGSLRTLQFCNGVFTWGTNNDGQGDLLRQIQTIYDGGTPDTGWSGTVTVTNTSIEVDVTYDDAAFNLIIDFYCLIEFSDPYTAAENHADAKELLAEWDLTRDDQYPWRTDGYLTVAPYVTRKEKIPTTSDQFETCDFVDPQADYYTGEILGAPKDAGYDRYFDFSHITWERGGAPTFSWFQTAFGAWSGQPNATDPTDGKVPGTATQWTENKKAGELWPHAFAYGDNNGTFLQKTAEIIIPKRSLNFARPCGVDRYELLANTVSCIASMGGGSLTVDGPENLEIDTGDTVLVIGTGEADDGVYTVTKTGSHTYDLGTRLFAAPGAPQDNQFIGKMRFPDAWAICGRIAISAAEQDGSNVNITLATAATYLRTGDEVDFSGVSGLGSSVTVTVTDSTHIVVAGTLSGAYVSGGYLKSSGAPDYWWNDNQTKGSYLYLTWKHNFRDYQERNRVITQYAVCNNCAESEPEDLTPIRENQALWGMPQSVAEFNAEQSCVSHIACHPAVVCVTPNEEAATGWTVKAFPTDFAPDARYGALWQARVEQEMDDPFWAVPPQDCDAYGYTWLEDTGQCLLNDFPNAYYPRRPTVEPLLDFPDDGGPSQNATAPDNLPDGKYLGYLTLVELDTVTEPTGNVAAPDGVADYGDDPSIPTGFVTAWVAHLAKLQCIESEGRFAVQYTDQGIV